MNIHEQLIRADITIHYKAEGCWWINKDRGKSFKTYAEAFDEAVRLLHPLKKFSVIMRFNRGLGIEYRSLPEVEAKNPGMAHDLASEAAASYVKETDGMEKAAILEIRVRPIANK